MLRRRMMMAQGGVSLPAGYTKLEYLESDGTQYIDTGFKPNQDTRVVMDVQLLTSDPTAYQGVFGARSANTTQLWVLYHYINLQWTFRYGAGTTNHYITSAATQRVKIDTDANVMTIGGTSVSADSATFSTAYSLYLFAINNAGSVEYPCGQSRIYSCRIYDNGTLIRNYVPAMNASNVAGLYDLVNDVFYPLLQVVTKVVNKLTVSTGIDENDDGTFSAMSTVAATYIVTSTLTVTTKGYNGSLAISETLYLYAGSSRGFAATWLGDNPTITSISPTEDDTYIYTF